MDRRGGEKQEGMFTKLALHEIPLFYSRVNFVVSDELEKEGFKAEHDSEDDLEWGSIDNYENPGPSRREGLEVRRVQWGDSCEA